MRRRLILSTLALTFTVACTSDENESADTNASDTTGGEDGGNPADFPLHSCAEVDGPCIEVPSGDTDALQIAANTLEDGTTLILGAGVYDLANQVTIRAQGITLWGQGKGTEGSFDEGTILDFASQTTQSNGVDAIGDEFAIADLAIVDAKKDGLRIEDSDGVTIQRVRATWRRQAGGDAPVLPPL